ncbi:MAG: putative Na+/H+ antiporter [Zoogloeaceae bacterium]|jgi:Na+/H+ antiporter NhaD/arsenite permease-like protein|nr:putative Na+/H+ antiporter [Zoogloeaceae bacterium]
MSPDAIQIVGTLIFAVAILHTFSVGIIAKLAVRNPANAGLWRLLTEVETVFGIWAVALVLFIAFHSGSEKAVSYLDSLTYTEPMFVFAIMVMAASRPIIQFSAQIVRVVSSLLPISKPVAVYFTIMSVTPLLSSFITEPAAMTLAALMLKEQYYSKNISARLMYVTIGCLFVNVSIGGTLTNFAAPPVLMVAHAWNWSSLFMLENFGWRSAVAVFFNAVVVTLLFRKELSRVVLTAAEEANKVPLGMMTIHLFLLFVIVCFSHDAPVFIGAFLLFMFVASAYPQHQDRLILREGLMVACFLAGLVTLGGQQGWWLTALFAKMDAASIYYGATALTAVTDNAALTFLGTQVPGLTDEFKYALVSGAVTGGGLTVIANAPNPAGMSILKGSFKDGTVSPLWLFLSAALPTVVAILAFRLL